MKNIWTIMKKEFSRFFRDRRLVMTLILPGILIYVLYSLLGDFVVSKIDGGTDNYVYQVYAINMPETFKLPFEAINDAAGGEESESDGSSEAFGGIKGIEITDITEEEKEEKKGLVADQKADLLVVFPADFEERYAAAVTGEAEELPGIKFYYNSARTESAAAQEIFYSVLDYFFQEHATGYFTVDDSEADPSDLVSDKDITGMMFSTVAPMLVLMLLFSGCMAVAPESIAGEKERGTFATMLVTPAKRSHIAIGKILSLSALSLLSGVCSFIGIILSLPKLTGGMNVSAAAYAFSDYLMLLGIVLSSVLVIVALISVISAFSKSVKEASGMIAPLMILVMLLGISTMFSSGAAGKWLWYLIPLYNSARAMSCIFSFTPAIGLNVLITVCANIVVAALLSFGLTKMFDSEKVMFNK